MALENETEFFPIGDAIGRDVTTWLRRDVNAGTTYYGYALTLGADPAAATWKIRREVLTGNVTVVTYADGDGLYNNVWNDRASLSYK